LNNRLVTRIVFSLVIVIIFIFAIFYWTNMSVQKELGQKFEQQYASGILQQTELALDLAYGQSEALVQALEHNSEMIEAFADGDRERLGTLLAPLFESWVDEYDIAQSNYNL
jgi:hypothetical protein